MADEPLVDIVMPAYNHADFVGATIESLQAQSYRPWRLLVRDDGSQDGTADVIARAAAADDRIQVIKDDLGNLGSNGSYHHLVRLSRAPYVMCCDSDDVWLPTKIELTLDAMRKAEHAAPQRPVLVHCDAVVVDEKLSVLRDRFIGRRGRKKGLSALLFANCVQGATVMMNAPLREAVFRVPPILIFDSHYGLIAAALGQRIFVEQPLLLYRQHTRNLVGAGLGKPQRSRVSHTLQIAIDAFPSVMKTLDVFRPDMAAARAKELDDFAEVMVGSNVFRRVLIALKRDYGFFSRRDRLNLLLYICGLPNI